MSSEFVVIDWLGRGWLLVLAFTAVVLLVAVLRKPCRHLFGTERAFQLWLLPPLAMLASQLPHAVTAPAPALPPVVYAITSATAALPVHGETTAAADWRAWLLFLWLLGTVACLLLAAFTQSRYRLRLRGAVPLDDWASRWPVWRADSADVGPALVGAWRGRIVLPADFERRYDPDEQRLILAHEAMHAHRFDGCWCLCAQVVTALFWFHPLAWWALAALRHDQELACDAAVLREHHAQRRNYAKAMLKTQSAVFALPVGCPWSPRHPITERIAMLKLPTPGRLRRIAGRITVVAIVLGASMAAYAAYPAPRTYAASKEAIAEAMVLFDGTKAAVASYAFHHDFRLPSDNEAAELPADPNLINGKFVRRVSVRDGVIVAVLREKPDAMATAGSVRLVPHADRAKQQVTWTCDSADIPEIAKLEPSCFYRPQAVVEAPAGDPAAAGEYQLNMSIELSTDSGGSENVRRASLGLCTTPGKTATVKVQDWQFDVTPMPEGAGRLRIDMAISDSRHEPLAQASLYGSLDAILHADGKTADGKSRYVMQVTPLKGCPARA